MKKIILISLPVILLIFFLPKISDAYLTALIKQKLPDYIPIEELNVHIKNKTLSVEGKLLGKIPVDLCFDIKFSKKHIVLIPKNIPEKLAKYLNPIEIIFPLS